MNCSAILKKKSKESCPFRQWLRIPAWYIVRDKVDNRSATSPRAVAKWLVTDYRASNPLYDQFGRQKAYDAASKIRRWPKRITNRLPTTDNLQETILRPMTTNCRTNIVSGCRKVGDLSLRGCDHACQYWQYNFYAIVMHVQKFIHIHNVPRTFSYLISLCIWSRSAISPRTIANY